ncbi:MAG: bifunctional nuclease family protein [Candidatus Rokubacteria bacterium]|nr:bifunctional nuclease family protein [Candidatus Rokubacteria bacterium]
MNASVRIVAVLLLAVVVAADAVARERAEAPAPIAGVQEADVVGVVLDQRSQQPAIVIQGKRDRRQFAMAIDVAQVTAIAVPLQGVTPPRPLTHDLFLTLFGRLKVTLTKVVITDLRDDVYYSVVHLTTGTGDMTLDSRPSDAIALAIRAKVPVFVDDRVFDKAGGTIAPPKRPHI